jgi:hypothetical protein
MCRKKHSSVAETKHKIDMDTESMVAFSVLMQLQTPPPSVSESFSRPLLVNVPLYSPQHHIAKVVSVHHVAPVVVSVHPRHSESPVHAAIVTPKARFSDSEEQLTEPIERKKPKVAALDSIYCESVCIAPRGPGPPLSRSRQRSIHRI